MIATTAKAHLQIAEAAANLTQALGLADARGGCDYKLLSTENLPVGELHALLAQHRRDGWAIAHLLVDDDDQITGINDLLELGILLKRERSA